MNNDDFDFDIELPTWASVAIIVATVLIFSLCLIGLTALVKSG